MVNQLQLAKNALNQHLNAPTESILKTKFNLPEINYSYLSHFYDHLNYVSTSVLSSTTLLLQDEPPLAVVALLLDANCVFSLSLGECKLENLIIVIFHCGRHEFWFQAWCSRSLVSSSMSSTRYEFQHPLNESCSKWSRICGTRVGRSRTRTQRLVSVTLRADQLDCLPQTPGGATKCLQIITILPRFDPGLRSLAWMNAKIVNAFGYHLMSSRQTNCKTDLR